MAEPYPKSTQLARGERRYRRVVASPKQWQAIIAAKRGPCRVCKQGGVMQMHHLVSRGAGLGDDVADNLVPLCFDCHALVTDRKPGALLTLEESLTGPERAYLEANR